jgi:hypothetical protein
MLSHREMFTLGNCLHHLQELHPGKDNCVSIGKGGWGIDS